MTSILKEWPIFGLLDPDFISDIRMVLIYDNNPVTSYLIVKGDQTVYFLGNQSCDCCATRHTPSEKTTVCSQRIITLYEQKIKTIAYGISSRVILVLTENGKVYSYSALQPVGCCRNYVPHNMKEINVQNEFVMDIACGNSHYIALTKTGKVYIWGTVKDGITERYISDKPAQVCADEINCKFHSITCGTNHCIAVSFHGHMYSWGCNALGQLGVNNNMSFSSTLRKVKYFSQILIEKVACGKNHTLALSNKGTLYCWGDNSHGQLGTSLMSNQSSIPVIPQGMSKVLDVAASYCANISVAMGRDHKIYMWGECLDISITFPKLILVDNIYDVFALYASPKCMHQPFIINNEETKKKDDVEAMNILDQIMAAFDDKNTSDFTIEVQGKPIYVHKAILKIRSKYFNAMFQGNWKENNDSVLKIYEFSYLAYRAFLKFLYTDEIDATIPIENVLEMLELAHLYGDIDFKACFAGVANQKISSANTALLYSVAVKYNNLVLKERCIRFAVTQMKNITKSSSFYELTKETMKNFMIDVRDKGASNS